MEDFEDTDHVTAEHDRLVSAISKLDKTQHISEPTRNELTNVNSEFNLIRRSNKLDLNRVVNVLGDTAHHVQISKKLRKTQEPSKVLPKPLEKPQVERIKRATGYEEAKKKVGRWDAVVATGRTVDYVSYPIKHVPQKMQTIDEFLSKSALKSPLELELEKVDPPAAQDEENEEEQLYPMNYQEMMEHRQHSAKIRAQQSYKAAKAKRQSKIKSKKYHRVLKKEKMKNQLKEFEELQKKDPEEALKKLEALEKARALERHTLRHKNTGKWAKSKLVRAKYDKDVRQELAEQLAVSRGLTKKVHDIESSDDETETNEAESNITLSQDPMNPWMLKRSDKSNVDAEFDFAYKKYIVNNKATKSKTVVKKAEATVKKAEATVKKAEAIVKKAEATVKKAQATSDWVVESLDSTTSLAEDKSSLDVTTAYESYENKVTNLVEKKLKKIRHNIERLDRIKSTTGGNKRQKEESDNLDYLMFKNKKVRAVIDEELIETATGKIKDVIQDDPIKTLPSMIKTTESQDQPQGNTDTNIDPSKFNQVNPKYLKTSITTGENRIDQLDDDDDDEQVVPKVNIEEMFEDDLVVASFRQEKEEENKVEDIDLSLPGWGSWGGKGVKASKRRRNRFILKAAPVTPRRDENKGNIIIRETKNPKLAVHKVTEVPFPFASVKDYEASIRAPLGNTFIPEKAHKKLIRPNVITKAGAIIEPMDEDELLVKRIRNLNK